MFVSLITGVVGEAGAAASDTIGATSTAACVRGASEGMPPFIFTI